MTLEEFYEQEKKHRELGQTVLIDELKKIFDEEPELEILAVTRQSTYNDEGYNFGNATSPVTGDYYEGWDYYAVNGMDLAYIYNKEEGYDLPSEEMHNRVGQRLFKLSERVLNRLLGAWGWFQVIKEDGQLKLEVREYER